jgi:glucose-6-phosphate 1-dehydrogenase
MPRIRTLLLLGATGDLARRYLLPAVGALHAAGRLPEGFHIIGAARGDLDNEGFRRLAGNVVPSHMLTYRTIDLADPSSLAVAIDAVTGPAAIYLAVPPRLFATTIEALGDVGFPSGGRVAIEKPFGSDLDSAHALNELLADSSLDAYRVDHVLGMETVQNLIEMRRANPILDRLWNGKAVEQVEILWEETLGLEGRAGYYDRAGALIDVLQNHMLQLLALVGMELPAGEADLPERKLDALRSVRMSTESRRARYTAGRLADGREVPAYADEDGVDPDRGTETLAEVTLELEMPRWTGTRFVLRAGKALSQQRKLVRLRLEGGGELELGVDGPETIVLRLTGAANQALELRAPGPSDALPPYAHVLLDLLGGTDALSVSGEEVEQQWRVVGPVLSWWKGGHVPLKEYPAGSIGPG